MTNRAPLTVAIVLLLLPVLYLGSYLALVVPGGRWVGNGPTFYRRYYQYDGEILPQLFWPLGSGLF